MFKDLDNEERMEMWNSPAVIEAVFLECMYWSLGATLIESSREIFDQSVKQIAGLMAGHDDMTNFAGPGEIPNSQPLLYDYHFDTGVSGLDPNIKASDASVNEETESKIWCWKPWKVLVQPYEHDVSLRFNQILVPTVDTTRTEFLLTQMAQIKRPIVLAGESGTSKSATIDEFLRKLDKNEFSILPINFSSRTTSMDVQRNLEANIEKKNKRHFWSSSWTKRPKKIDRLYR